MVKDFNKLSERQQNILKFMATYMNDHGFPPTIREIGEATNINSTSVVNYNLNKLVDAGYIDRTGKKSRGLRLVAPVPGVVNLRQVKESRISKQVPLMGQIAAGIPIEIPGDMSHVDEDDYLDVTPMMLGGADPEQTFALKVEGDSMIDAMINDGDIVIFRSQQTANNGDMVAVWLPADSETTLKYFYKEGDRIRLQPAHPTMDAIYVSADNCEIRGKVLSVIRRVH